jgi:hypothetical protein
MKASAGRGRRKSGPVSLSVLLVTLAITAVAWAQNLFPSSGRVGIATTGPLEVLHVEGGRVLLRNSASNPTFILDAGAATGAASDLQHREHGTLRSLVRFGADADGATFSFQDRTGGQAVTRFYVSGDGRVGIGTLSPKAGLHVTTDVRVDGNIAARYQDVAEWVPADSLLPAGAVVTIDLQHQNRVVLATQPYDTRVAGVVSMNPGLILGEAGTDRVKVAHLGRVKVKADAAYGPITIGDLLVTSPTPGHAMRSEAVEVGEARIHRPGTLIGKALEGLDDGKGEILVLLMLQ